MYLKLPYLYALLATLERERVRERERKKKDNKKARQGVCVCGRGSGGQMTREKRRDIIPTLSLSLISTRYTSPHLNYR